MKSMGIRSVIRSGDRGILLLSSSLLGTGVPIAARSSRSRLCRTWFRNAGSLFVHGNTSFRTLFTDHFITVHYSSFSLEVGSLPR